MSIVRISEKINDALLLSILHSSYYPLYFKALAIVMVGGENYT